MNTKNEVPNPVVTEVQRIDGAKQMFDTIEALRQQIPVFPFPVVPGNARQLAFTKDVPAVFLELTNAAIGEREELARKGVQPDQLRDLATYAVVYGPIADAMERLAIEMRHSVNTARSKAGSEALLTYEVTQRLAVRPEHADLAPLVQDMRQALGVQRKLQAAKRRANQKHGTPTTPTTPTTPVPQHPPVTTTPGTTPAVATASEPHNS